MLDINTRERANKIHLDQMYRESNKRQVLRNANQMDEQEKAPTKPWLRFAIAFAWMAVFLGLFVIIKLI
jgi:hypothetical protein